MSGTADDRWRSGRPGNDNSRQNNSYSRQTSNASDRTNTAQSDRQSTRGPAMPRSKDLNASGAQKNDKATKNGTNAILPRDEHIPVNGFNGKELKAEMQKSNEPKPMTYKLPKPENAGSRPGNAPWGIKANTMANGKDFFLELRRQVSVAQKNGGTTLGG